MSFNRVVERGDLSQAAKELCAGWFFFGEKAVVTSHAPHASLKANRTAMDELLAAGLVSQESYNVFGSVRFYGTVEAGKIGREISKGLMQEMFPAAKMKRRDEMK